LPRTVASYIWQTTARHQLALSALSAAVFLISAVPLEIQRRIVNDAIKQGVVSTILWLGAAYAGVALAEGGLKLALNIYRAWVSESAVRHLRNIVSSVTGNGSPGKSKAGAGGVEVSMVLTEVEPVGGFIGSSVSEPLMQGGILVTVFGYMLFLDPTLAFVGICVFSPQFVFVPLMQGAINRRAQARVQTLREVSGTVIDGAEDGKAADAAQAKRIDHVFALNMGIFKLKFTMNFFMNFAYHAGIATALGIGGWFAVEGRIEVGTVVAFISGLAKVNDPWGDIVNWYREATVVAVKYRLLADAARALARGEPAPQPKTDLVEA
jgi:ABC-type multidrug transport system fused ATPase/permease subunit